MKKVMRACKTKMAPGFYGNELTAKIRPEGTRNAKIFQDIL